MHKLRTIATISAILWATVAARANSEVLGAKWKYLGDLSPDNLFLSLNNPSSAPVCIPRVNVTGAAVRFYQRGKEVLPYYFANRPVLMWHSVDLIEGLIVIPPHGSYSIVYNLRDWRLRAGPTNTLIEVPSLGCADLFNSTKPRSRPKNFAFSFIATPRETR